MSEAVTLTQDAGVATISFNRADQLNTLDAATGIAFEAAALKAVADPKTRVILLRGEGRSFMAGGDLASFRDAENRSAEAARIIQPVHRALAALEASPCITMVAAQGAVAGGGMSIFLGADLAIISDTASFNMAYARIAVTPDCAGTWALPRLVGLRRALEMVLLSETITAERALALGLATKVVPEADLDAEADKLARRLAAGPGFAQGQMKALLRSSMARDYAAQLDAEQAGFVACAARDDFSEGLAAFFEKRRPEFLKS